MKKIKFIAAFAVAAFAAVNVYQAYGYSKALAELDCLDIEALAHMTQ